LEVLDGGAGLVADHDRPDDMAEALDRIIDSPELAARMGRLAWAEAREVL
jgi:glycosyltransferase involved in cell wall biosynthesis